MPREQKEREPLTHAHKTHMPWILKELLKLLCAAAIVVGAFYALKQNGFTLTRRTSVSVIRVEQQLQAIGEFATYEYTYKDVARQTSTRTIAGIDMPGTTSQVFIIYNGVIKVGYLVEEIAIEVDENAMEIRVTLPDPIVTDNYIDEDNVQLIEENNIFNPLNSTELFENIAENKATALQDAEEAGLYDKARENAEVIIRACLSAFDAYDVVFL